MGGSYTMINFAILDDDEETIDNHIKKISSLLEKYHIDGEIIIATTDYEKFIRTIDENKVNCCIIDINLKKNTNGMHVAKQIRKDNREIKIIFFTACVDFIQLAFEVQAYWFIQKPNWDLLETALIKLDQDMRAIKQKLVCIECNTGDKDDHGQYFIPFDNIYYIDCLNEKTYVHTVKDKAGKNEYITSEALKALANRIDDSRLQQCYRSIFINIDKIQHINSKCTSLTLHDGSMCDIGPSYRQYFRNWRPTQ